MPKIFRLIAIIATVSFCGVSLDTRAAGAATTQYVILNTSNNFTDTVEPGATIDQLGHSLSVPVIGGGPLLGTGLLFACGTSNIANFSESSAPLGGPKATSSHVPIDRRVLSRRTSNSP